MRATGLCSSPAPLAVDPSIAERGSNDRGGQAADTWSIVRVAAQDSEHKVLRFHSR